MQMRIPAFSDFPAAAASPLGKCTEGSSSALLVLPATLGASSHLCHPSLPVPPLPSPSRRFCSRAHLLRGSLRGALLCCTILHSMLFQSASSAIHRSTITPCPLFFTARPLLLLPFQNMQLHVHPPLLWDVPLEPGREVFMPFYEGHILLQDAAHVQAMQGPL